MNSSPLSADSPATLTGDPNHSRRLQFVIPRVSLGAFALLSFVLAIRSDGAWLDDDLCHYEIARAAWRLPTMLLNAWGRPGCTIPYALVAGIGQMPTGFRAARLLTTVMATLIVWLAWLTAKKIRTPFAWLVPTILLLMPEFLAESYTPCTEIPAALYAIAGTYLLASGRHRQAAIFFALLPATRHELAPFLVPLGVWFLWRRDWLAALLLGWFEALWAGISWKLGMEQPILRYFTAQDSAPYGAGPFYHYFVYWLKMAGPVVVVLCLAGAWTIATHEGRAGKSRQWRLPAAAGRRARVRLLVVGWTIGLVALETVLFSFNHFASGGYSVFLVPAAPLMAICACYGVSALHKRLNSKVMIGCGLIAVVQVCVFVHPYRLSPFQLLLQNTIAQLHRDDPGCHIVGDSAWIVYFDEFSPGAREQNAQDTWKLGTALPLYYLCNADSNVGATIEQLNSVPCERMQAVGTADAPVELLIFRRLSGGTRH